MSNNTELREALRGIKEKQNEYNFLSKEKSLKKKQKKKVRNSGKEEKAKSR